jgi:hypothetical protein
VFQLWKNIDDSESATFAFTFPRPPQFTDTSRAWDDISGIGIERQKIDDILPLVIIHITFGVS